MELCCLSINFISFLGSFYSSNFLFINFCNVPTLSTFFYQASVIYIFFYKVNLIIFLMLFLVGGTILLQFCPNFTYFFVYDSLASRIIVPFILAPETWLKLGLTSLSLG